MKSSTRESKEANASEARTEAACCMVQGSPCRQGESTSPQFVTPACPSSTQNQTFTSCYRYLHIQKVSLPPSPTFLPGRLLVAGTQQMLKEVRQGVSGRAKADQPCVIFPRDSSKDREECLYLSLSLTLPGKTIPLPRAIPVAPGG